jgi:hypothetical protein
MLKYSSILLVTLLLISACSEAEKERVADALNSINLRNGESVDKVTKLAIEVQETSGLSYIDGQLWTHNDSGGEPKLYRVDKGNGKVLKTVTILNATNKDWEDLAFDDEYLYIGDFGNNMGKRKDLKIYKVKREALKTDTNVTAEIIKFTYDKQTDFKSNKNTAFDCEAFIAYEGKLYLFSKNHKESQTDLYRLDTKAGTDVAEYVTSYHTQVLITGASIDVTNKALALSGYTDKLSPKTWIFKDFTDADFFKGKKEQISWGAPSKAQIEGITHIGKGKLFISTEKFKYTGSTGSFSLSQSLYRLNY